jgi:hypothetical protein
LRFASIAIQIVVSALQWFCADQPLQPISHRPIIRVGGPRRWRIIGVLLLDLRTLAESHGAT